MNRVLALPMGLLMVLLLTAGNCSRARVESVSKMNEGVLLAQQRRYDEAAQRLESAGAIDPTNEQAFYNLALVHMEMKAMEAAKRDLDRAIALNGNVAGYHEKLGTVCLELKQWDSAQKAFEAAIAADPKLFKAYYKLAQVYEQKDDAQRALEQYTKAIEAGPRFLEAYSQLGRLYANLGYPEQAVQVLRGALQVAHPGSDEEASVHHLLGTVYQEQKKFSDAITEFKAALQIVPGMPDALFSLGWTYALAGEKEDAKRYLKKYLDIGGTNAPQHYQKAARDRLAELEMGT